MKHFKRITISQYKTIPKGTEVFVLNGDGRFNYVAKDGDGYMAIPDFMVVEVEEDEYSITLLLTEKNINPYSNPSSLSTEEEIDNLFK